MNKKKDKKNLRIAPLRAAAEARLAEMPQNYAQATPDETATATLLHELRLHQIELEIQNAALRRAQTELEASRDRYLDLYEFAPIGYLTLTRDALIIEANLTAATLLGMERKSFRQRFAAFVVPADLDRWQRFFLRAMRYEKKLSCELALARADGANVHVRLDCRLRNIGGASLLRMALIDVTAQRRSEAALRLRSAALEVAADAIHITDPQGIIEWINPAFSALTGYSENEAVGRSPQELVKSGRQNQEFYRNLWDTISSGMVWRGELINRRKDGAHYYEYQTITPLCDEAGKIGYYIAIKNDITERKAMDQERLEYLNRLEKKARRLVAVQEDARRLLARELHDRTSPNLAAIALNLDLIAAGCTERLSPEFAARLDDTRGLLADTGASIREICAELRPAVLDYAGLPAAMESYAHQFTRRTGIATHVGCAQSDVRLAPDLESLLFRIFQEAMTNCAKHAGAKSIRVELRHEDCPVVLTVLDDGLGFDPALLGYGRESGLGVLNMREMVAFVGGTLIIESQPGKGTLVKVEIK